LRSTQIFELPSHVSATSQSPAGWRQTVPDAATPSAGQAALDPVQVSATSQASLAARHTVVLDLNPRSTQVPLLSQVSWFSHAPGMEPQLVPDGAGTQLPPMLRQGM
jgi:hypothetical protein